MLNDPLALMAAAAVGVVGLSIASAAGLKAWNGWLDVKRLELSCGGGDRSLPSPMARIDVADLKERVRKLEAIAAGVEF